MIIRKAQKSDIDQILKLNYENSFATSPTEDIFWPKEILEKVVFSDDAIIFVSVENREITGFVIAGIVKSMEKLHCENIFVRSEFRKQGIGEKLMQKLLDEAKKLNLRYIVALTNKANSFFKRIGFEEGSEFTWYDLNLKT